MWKQLWVNFLFGVFTTIDADIFPPARADADMFDPDAALCEK